MGLKLQSSSGGSVELVVPVTASAFTATVPAQNCTLGIQGPAFSAWANVNQNLAASNTFYKINFDAEEFDTNSNFANGRFTPTVAGYYMLTSAVALTATSGVNEQIYIYKNGAAYKFIGLQSAAGTPNGSALVYLNGSTDYVEIWGKVTGTGSLAVSAGQASSYFQGVLVRAE